eukprot:2725206-Pyramimonas_sp.AAC.1
MLGLDLLPDPLGARVRAHENGGVRARGVAAMESPLSPATHAKSGCELSSFGNAAGANSDFDDVLSGWCFVEDSLGAFQFLSKVTLIAFLSLLRLL